jgi:hypothetical protein
MFEVILVMKLHQSVNLIAKLYSINSSTDLHHGQNNGSYRQSG